MTVVDAHHHLWDPAVRRYPFLQPASMAPIRRRYGLDELRQRCAESGIDHTVLVQTVAEVDETEEFLRTADESDGLIAGVVGWVDLTDSAVASTIARLREGPGGHLMVGVRHPVQDEEDPEWLLKPDVLAGLRAVAEAGLVYDLLVRADQLPMATAAVRAVPEGRYVLDHAAKPHIAAGERYPWVTQIAELAALPQVACKLSGLVTEADWESWTHRDLEPYARTVFDVFTPERTMFGTDWPVCEVAAEHHRVVETARHLVDSFATGASERVFGQTALEHYRLRVR
ncbi:amidohydrolase family protein [Phytoactinopolyspora halotolerans]|uniref:Amidohydrolase family protein n=1 Tax=Phytoactinopolyspora halotolerans TaxID=1981512 RepID=A0A6L9S557_9ACTN|nr:amidohydrolase family protein [Phytoactinopolyspora halotolerans]NED99870.1 amidohydrolase family protein [Phytoactinopolyspora halotolerans]